MGCLVSSWATYKEHFIGSDGSKNKKYIVVTIGVLDGSSVVIVAVRFVTMEKIYIYTSFYSSLSSKKKGRERERKTHRSTSPGGIS